MAKGDVGGNQNPSQVGGNFSPPNPQSNSPLAMNPSMGQTSPLMNMGNTGNPMGGRMGTMPMPRTNLMPQGPMQQPQQNPGLGNIDPNLIRQLLMGGLQ